MITRTPKHAWKSLHPGFRVSYNQTVDAECKWRNVPNNYLGLYQTNVRSLAVLPPNVIKQVRIRKHYHMLMVIPPYCKYANGPGFAVVLKVAAAESLNGVERRWRRA